ncbi:MAG: TIGR00266 family protein [Anaerolineales bacterium]|nr:TIGR00266 family protein [Anaerolineales bacterium]
MQVEILYRPSYSVARVTLDQSEKIQTESGAMVGMSPDMEMETEAKGGVLKSIARSMFGGESFFMNTYTGENDGDRILLAPPLPGDIAVVELQNDSLLVQSGSYLASSEGVQVDTKWSGAKTFFGSEGLVMLRVSGTGTLIISSYGAIHPMELNVSEKYVVDTGHLVSFEEVIGYDVKKVAGWKSTLFSGEGLVAELTGPGKINLQSRSQDSFLSWLIPRIPERTTYVSSGS